MILALLFGAVSLLYATVGQAGGTAFLALMAFASFPSNEMRPTALLLNIVAASYSTWLFNRGSLVDWAKLRPLLVASLGDADRQAPRNEEGDCGAGAPAGCDHAPHMG